MAEPSQARATSPDTVPAGAIRLAVIALFFSSGATSLVYEIVWTRQFSVIFGSTALAASSVLAAFMAGLALGSHTFGRFVDRRGGGLRLYGLLEIGIAACAVLLLPLLSATGDVFVAIHRTFHPSYAAMNLVRFVFAFLLLLVPTALMGGTLPILVRTWMRRPGEAGRSLGVLYAVNTLGAMTGCLAAGFWLIATFGARNSVLGTALFNVLIGGTAVLLAARVRARATETPAPPAASAPPAAVSGESPRPRLALAAIGISGFLALAYEIVWTRVLIYVLSASVYSFAIMLGTFLAGLALGSLILAGRVDRVKAGYRLFGVLEILIGASALASVLLLSRYQGYHDALLDLFRVRGWDALVAVKFVEAATVVFVPTLLMGMTFPVVSRLYVSDLRGVGGRVGNIVAVNTLGAVLGSFAAGFLLIPAFGTQTTIAVLAVANALLGGALILAPRREWSLRRVAAALSPAALLLVASVLLPDRAFLPVFGINLRGGEIIYFREGITGTVTIHESPGSRLLSINGADVAGTSMQLRTTQKLQAHIPLLLHPEPRRVLQVGLGSGETARSILRHPVDRLVGVDISPEVIEAGPYFSDINRNVYDNPRLEIVIEDAKNFVQYTDATFDLILNDSVHPVFRGSADLYTRDYFRACRERLAEGGMMSSWFPLGLLTQDDLRMLLRTFQEVFPECSVWIGTNCVTRNALLLGWKGESPFAIDFGRVVRRMRDNPSVAEDLAEVNLGTPLEFLDAFQLDSRAVRELTRGARINTYDLPAMEFTVPRALALGDVPLWAGNFEMVTSNRVPVLTRLANLGDTEEQREAVRRRLERRHEASGHVIEGLLHEVEQSPMAAHRAYAEALEVYPEDPLANALLDAGERESSALQAAVAAGTTDPETYYRLARLRRSRGETAEAAVLLERAVELRPEYVRAYVDLAGARRELGDRKGALEAVERAIALDTRLLESYVMRGRLRADAGDLEGAEADLRHACEGGAGTPWAETLLGEVLWRQGEREEAERRFRTALDLDPEHPPALAGLGMLLARAGREEEAVAWLERAAETGAGPMVRLELAGALKRLGHTARGIEELRRACEEHPEFAEAHNRLALALAKEAASVGEALRHAERAVALHPDDGYFLDTLGWVQLRAGRLEAAAATLAKALDELAPAERVARAVVLYHSALVQRELGRDEAARAELERALATSADFPEVGEARELLRSLGG